MTLRKRIFGVLMLCVTGSTLAFDLHTLKAQFQADAPDVRLFRAQGMMNHYYAMPYPDAHSDRGVQYLQSIIDLFPEYKLARITLIEVLETQQNWQEAFYYAQSAQQQFPDDAYIQKLTYYATEHFSKKSGLTEAFQPLPESNDSALYTLAKTSADALAIQLLDGHAVSGNQDNGQIDAVDRTNPSLRHVTVNNAPGSSTKVLTGYDIAMNQFYALKKKNPQQARRVLESIVQRYADRFEPNMEMGYARLAEQDNAGALPYFLAAQKIKPDDYQLANQIGFVESALYHERESIAQFHRAASHAEDETINRAAQIALINLSDSYFKVLSSPYFAEFYAEPFYLSRFNDAIYPITMRVGAQLGDKQQIVPYLGYRRNTDSQSQVSLIPQIYNDNYELFSAGLRVYPTQGKSWFVYGEAGRAHDLLPRGTTPWRADYRAGVIAGRYWGAEADYNKQVVIEWKPWAEWYSDFSYFSRYENAIGQMRLDLGARVLRYKNSMLSLYVRNNMFLDTAHEFYNNIFEQAPGIVWMPYNKINLKIRYEHFWGQYLPVNSPSPNPYGKHYQTDVVRLEFGTRL